MQIPTSYASSIRSYQYARSDRTGFYTASQYGDAVTEDSLSCASGESQFFSSPGQENEYYGTQILEGDRSEKHEQTSAQAEENPGHQMGAQDIFMSLKSILGFTWLSKTLKMAMRPSIPAHNMRITWQCVSLLKHPCFESHADRFRNVERTCTPICPMRTLLPLRLSPMP